MLDVVRWRRSCCCPALHRFIFASALCTSYSDHVFGYVYWIIESRDWRVALIIRISTICYRLRRRSYGCLDLHLYLCPSLIDLLLSPLSQIQESSCNFSETTKTTIQSFLLSNTSLSSDNGSLRVQRQPVFSWENYLECFG